MTDTKRFFFEDLKIGQSDSFEKNISDDDVRLFAKISGDHNPIHLDQNFAAKSIFKQRIVHGALTAAFISAALGNKLPGEGSIFLEQKIQFIAPVKINDNVIATVTITELNPKNNRVTLNTKCTVNGKTVLKGYAIVLVPSRT